MTENASDFVDKKKAHRSRHSGRKAGKKEKKNENINENLSERQRNPRAFAFNSAIGAERRFRRKQDIETKKQHIPFVDRTPIEPPPILIVVVGPPKVGKSTLINNLVKLFSKSHLTDIKGPVTIVIGKKRRITLIECNNDINSMIDLAKVADLVLLLCDASFGFEMEIFEFLNICQVHGMPKIMGILTHLDIIKNSKTLKNIKKSLKHRFWTEIYPGAKLFYLSGIVHGEYLRNEIRNLGRFISIMKFRPLTWRMTHSYLLGDRYEDLTNLELIRQNPKCDRSISLYGYVRGVPLNNSTNIHIAGLGDLKIQNISYLPDPCPLPDTIKKRALIEKEKLVYAPFSGVGGIVYDKDAVYVELGGSHSHKIKDDDKTNNIITNLIGTKETLDIKMKYSELQLFTGGNKLTADDIKDLNQNSNINYNCLDDVELLQTNEKVQNDVNLNNELENLRNQSKVEEKTVHCDDSIGQKLIFASNDECNDNITSENETMQSKELEYAPSKNCKEKNTHLMVSNILSTFGKLENYNIEKINNDNWACETGTKVDSEIYSDSDNSVKNEQKSQKKNNTIDHIVIKKTNELSNKDNEVESKNDHHDMTLKWKENLLKKAEENYLVRLQTNKSLMKIVYGVFDEKLENSNIQKNDVNEIDEIGGLFRIISHEQQKQKIEKDSMDLTESSLLMSWIAEVPNYTNSENKWMIEDCFVTGKWKKSEDASELLELDTAEITSEVDECSNFEDLHTEAKINNESDSKKRKRDNEEMDKETLVEKKLKLKQKFDAEYDNVEGSYYDALKLTAEKQAQLNKSVFENIHDDVRVQIEGYRPGMYVRIEFENVSSDFVTNFDPTYPIVIGGLNMGEENIGYVNVKMKKHRWYNKILKANDPLIVSLGWRRFQTLPLYSKLEDDLKFRYLKYTPEHLSCNAHFWGPITPQGTGFLAIQTCEANPEIVKQQGFRVAATGAIQDLDKSTKIMKKLKLVGYPMKIYKKTAFIKGMFNSSLEVAKFEGARIKTVSGIRGQIKKVVSKPEGCFRATFEDKILLSDIVFCRTWYKVDVQQFYTPVTTLLLPPASKTSWKGIRTTGELKRELEFKKPVNKDNLYSEIVREPKVFKPLIIPRKLQQSLPYRDKPHHGTNPMEDNKRINRIAVIKEPYEQKVSKIMKMIKTTYDHKQQQLKKQTKERLEKHKLAVEMVEANKAKKLKKQKKKVFRIKSKMQLKEEKRSEYDIK